MPSPCKLRAATFFSHTKVKRHCTSGTKLLATDVVHVLLRQCSSLAIFFYYYFFFLFLPNMMMRFFFYCRHSYMVEQYWRRRQRWLRPCLMYSGGSSSSGNSRRGFVYTQCSPATWKQIWSTMFFNERYHAFAWLGRSWACFLCVCYIIHNERPDYLQKKKNVHRELSKIIIKNVRQNMEKSPWVVTSTHNAHLGQSIAQTQQNEHE